MPVVTVDAELYRRVEEAAQEHKATIDEILAEASAFIYGKRSARRLIKKALLIAASMSNSRANT
jgi:hypothetical protein